MAADDHDSTALWLQAISLEYEAVRNEVNAAIHAHHATSALGAAALGVASVPGFDAWSDPRSLVSEVVFLAVVPAVAYFVATLWLGEVARMIRAGRHTLHLEKEINSRFSGARVLTWETDLWTDEGDVNTEKHFLWHYWSHLAAFPIVVVASVALGTYHLSRSESGWIAAVVAALEIVVLVAFLTFAFRQWNDLLPAKSRFNTLAGAWCRAVGCCTETTRRFRRRVGLRQRAAS